ncbi:unnamed protein product [Spirodela intermedia]|uniref:Rubredoxin-like domain-containing protein n=1 Tax=Spirodela intermedia TaxID=51605 RepID=A0A7I8I8J7_SPIIN|nr:unnamed protein product [Spirodela intermedia]CAA6653838.1 unnamed protein product [Spirodela intermedia]
MAAFATARAPLSFHLQSLSPPQTKTTGKNPFLPTRQTSSTLRLLPLFRRPSLGVSKEDKPLSEQDPPTALSQPEGPGEETEEELGEGRIDRRREEEKFVVLNTGIYECRGPLVSDPPGLGFEKLPEDWRCPTCGAAKSFFDSKSVEIAGFAQNQQFGLGGNSLTSGQKGSLIYGTLAFFFILFLLGYFLQ